MDLLIYKLVLLCLVSFTLTAEVKWVPNSSINLAINYRDGKLPCSTSNVIFPLTASVIEVQSVLEVGSLILPQDGELRLDGGFIVFGADDAEKNCTGGNSFYLDKAFSAWNQAGVWSSDRFNQATPDAERLPCFDDVVKFDEETLTTVKLPDEEQIIKGFVFLNMSLSTYEFEIVMDLSELVPLKFELNIDNDIGFDIAVPNCIKKFGCPCQEKPLKIDCSVKFCPKPSCESSIKPEGYCCPFCGGQLVFHPDDGFDRITFKELVDKVVDGYGDTLIYHIGIVSTEPIYKMQLVVMEKGKYDGLSIQAIDEISNGMPDHWFKGEKLSQISGIPLSKKGWGWKIFVTVFFVVVAAMGVVYLFYYKLPSVRIPGVGGGAREVFSSFQFRSGSVVSLMRRASSVSGELPARTAFRNPLYDSQRGSVVVEQSVDEE